MMKIITNHQKKNTIFLICNQHIRVFSDVKRCIYPLKIFEIYDQIKIVKLIK